LEGSGQRNRRERDRIERETERELGFWGFCGGAFGEGIWVVGGEELGWP